MPKHSQRAYSRSAERRNNSRSRSRSTDLSRINRDRSLDRNEEKDMCRLHIADLTKDVNQYDLERAFSKYGTLKEVWMAKNPPCFGFVVFENKEDAATAMREMDQRSINTCRIKVTFARPRSKGTRRFDPGMRCYQCGERGHFSRDCRRGYRNR